MTQPIRTCGKAGVGSEMYTVFIYIGFTPGVEVFRVSAFGI